MDIRRHQAMALAAATLLVVVVWASFTIIDLARTPIWADVVLLATLAGLFLIAFSWLMRVAVPGSLGIRILASVVVLLALALVALFVSAWWAFRDWPALTPSSPPVVDESRCTDVPQAVATGISSNLTVGTSNTVAWYEVKLEKVELVDPWVMVATSPGYEPPGYWIGVNSRGAHSYRSLGEEPSEWMPLNGFEGLVLFWSPDPLTGNGVLVLGDEPNGYRTRMFDLPSGDGARASDRDSIATVAYCLTGKGPFGIDFLEGWLWAEPWHEFSTRIEEPLWAICSNPPVYDQRCPNAISTTIQTRP